MIYFLPWGNRDTASSRLRVYNVLPYLEAKIGVPKNYKKGDVLIIQKALNMYELKRAQDAGVPVIYDIDDNYLDKQEFFDMAEEADIVTVGSVFFRQYYPTAPIIDDTLDWDGTEKVQPEFPPDNPKVGWHGYGNLNYVSHIAPILKKRGYRIRTIVGKDYLPFYSEYDSMVWSLDTIDKDLAECDLCCFYLPDDDFSQAKGMNKLIKAWAIGLPCFVSPTPEYERVMKEAGVEGFIVTDWETHDFTKPWEPKMREYALRFSGEEIAKQWMAVVNILK